MAVPPLIPLLTLASVFSFLAIPSSANDSNVLLTGDVLGADEQLSYGAATFVMQRDCNLVDYVEGRRVFQSYTRDHGVNCTLSLTDCGQLVITSSLGGSVVWRSPFLRGANRGEYAAVLRPDGAVAIYGPAVWSTPDYGFGAALVHEGWMHTLPAVKNVLFSSEMLYENGKLVTRDYSLLMKDDCNLVLVKASVGVIWQSGTAGRDFHCFLRLDDRGQLAVASDYYYKNLWSSNNASSIGDYALLLQINGQAVVYGPIVWLTTSSGTTFSSSPPVTFASPESLLDTAFSSSPPVTASSPKTPIDTKFSFSAPITASSPKSLLDTAFSSSPPVTASSPKSPLDTTFSSSPKPPVTASSPKTPLDTTFSSSPPVTASYPHSPIAT